MKRIREFKVTFCCAAVLWAGLVSSPLSLAQKPGNNVVQNSSGVTTSTAYIDASVITGTGSGTNICALINAALGLIGTTGYGTSTVIDARGIPQPGSTQTLSCAGNTPWVYGSTTNTPSATILLPAGIITTTATWTLPTGTRLVGEGSGAVGSSPTAVTTIQSSASTIIEMGSSSPTFCPKVNSSFVCTGISIEDLVINGEGETSIGIYNSNSQEQSYVKRVSLYQILGTGLKVLSGGANSGPYEDISFGTATTATTVPTCAIINGANTRGIHGITCTYSGSTTPTSGGGIVLGGKNNSLEDITVQGFHDGIQIGANAVAQGNVILNVSNGSPSVHNAVVHITTTNTVSDLVIMGVTKGSASYSIQDDNTASGSSTTALSDATVGIYAIGESVTVTHASNAYPRFTTSPSVPTWIRGSGTPGSSCVVGSLYSNTGGSGSNDFYVCTAANTWTAID
jgi:hypothetical protein